MCQSIWKAKSLTFCLCYSQSMTIDKWDQFVFLYENETGVRTGQFHPIFSWLRSGGFHLNKLWYWLQHKLATKNLCCNNVMSCEMWTKQRGVWFRKQLSGSIDLRHVYSLCIITPQKGGGNLMEVKVPFSCHTEIPLHEWRNNWSF